ncbi:MAG: hypothetical protein Ct9H90mP5_04310 [Acidimicrobiaceae bacterium]|nr:MAG: hypothetical protein Ct9H90mP5_04310 [Acidimicrobiaceae bacterium]
MRNEEGHMSGNCGVFDELLSTTPVSNFPKYLPVGLMRAARSI